jgi:hypothetical protein
MISHEFPRLGLLTFLTSCLLSHCPVRPGASSRGVSIDGNGCGARGRGKTHPPSPGGDGAPLAGTRTCRQELADRRGWSTFSKAWPVRRTDTAVARREAPARFERSVRSTERVSRLIGAPRPRLCPREIRRPAYPGPFKQYGRRSVARPVASAARPGAGCLTRERRARRKTAQYLRPISFDRSAVNAYMRCR